jgi:hypothetical protein
MRILRPVHPPGVVFDEEQHIQPSRNCCVPRLRRPRLGWLPLRAPGLSARSKVMTSVTIMMVSRRRPSGSARRPRRSRRWRSSPRRRSGAAPRRRPPAPPRPATTAFPPADPRPWTSTTGDGSASRSSPEGGPRPRDDWSCCSGSSTPTTMTSPANGTGWEPRKRRRSGSSTSGWWARTFGSRPWTPPGSASSEKRSERSRSQTRQGSPTQRRRAPSAGRRARLGSGSPSTMWDGPSWNPIGQPFQEPLGGVVRDVDLRQPDQEPRLPATPLQHDQPMTTMDATRRVRKLRHGL